MPALQPWQRTLAIAAAGTAPGLLVRFNGGGAPYPMQLLAYGAAVVAAAFMLAWACEAAQVTVSSGAVVAAVAFVAILPEFIVELHFAFTGRADYVTANLTGASRLLLGVCVALPAVAALIPRSRRKIDPGPIALTAAHRVELAVLGAGGLWALRGALRGQMSLLDSLVLVSLYVVYLRRAAGSEAESPAPVGVAASLAGLEANRRRLWVRGLMGYAAVVILLTAVPFGDAVLGTGKLVGISPYLTLQWIVPVATETPELVVAYVLLVHGRGAQSVAVLLAGAVSQYTLALGALPLAYLAGAGTGPLPLAPRERVELFLAVAIALYTVAALSPMRLSRGDSSIMLVLFTAQFALPAVVTRVVLAVAFAALAIDVTIAERRHLPALVRALTGRPPAEGRGGGPSRHHRRPRRDRRRRPSPAGARAGRSRR